MCSALCRACRSIQSRRPFFVFADLEQECNARLTTKYNRPPTPRRSSKSNKIRLSWKVSVYRMLTRKSLLGERIVEVLRWMWQESKTNKESRASLLVRAKAWTSCLLEYLNLISCTKLIVDVWHRGMQQCQEHRPSMLEIQMGLRNPFLQNTKR